MLDPKGELALWIGELDWIDGVGAFGHDAFKEVHSEFGVGELGVLPKLADEGCLGFNSQAEVNLFFADGERIGIGIDRFYAGIEAALENFLVALRAGISGFRHVENDEAAATKAVAAFEGFAIEPGAQQSSFLFVFPKKTAQFSQRRCELVLDAQP